MATYGGGLKVSGKIAQNLATTSFTCPANSYAIVQLFIQTNGAFAGEVRVDGIQVWRFSSESSTAPFIPSWDNSSTAVFTTFPGIGPIYVGPGAVLSYVNLTGTLPTIQATGVVFTSP